MKWDVRHLKNFKQVVIHDLIYILKGYPGIQGKAEDQLIGFCSYSHRDNGGLD